MGSQLDQLWLKSSKPLHLYKKTNDILSQTDFQCLMLAFVIQDIAAAHSTNYSTSLCFSPRVVVPLVEGVSFFLGSSFFFFSYQLLLAVKEIEMKFSIKAIWVQEFKFIHLFNM
ncbi:hypothetical protein ACJX0J_020903, partial [Zea mays]